VGGERSVPVDVRLVAATNADLGRMVADGRFRGDLFYRLSVLVIRLPALRDRPDDLLPLARHFVARHAGALAGAEVEIEDAAAEALRAHRWPGNVRELENVVQRALLAARGGSIGAADFRRAIAAAGEIPVAASGQETLESALARTLPQAIEHLPEGSVHATVFERVERQLLDLATAPLGGNQPHAARSLGTNRNTLRARLTTLGIGTGR